MPITMLTFFIGTLSIIGLPPAGGTWSKWYLALGTLEPGLLILLGVLMLSSLLSIGYLLVIPVRAFFGTDSLAHHGEEVHEAPLPMLLAMAATAAVTVALFLFPDPIFRIVQLVVGL
jgi:multicomponent Na+:H+ antiporter subunit D